VAWYTTIESSPGRACRISALKLERGLKQASAQPDGLLAERDHQVEINDAFADLDAIGGSWLGVKN